jgi:L-rhamnose mutarotase
MEVRKPMAHDTVQHRAPDAALAQGTSSRLHRVCFQLQVRPERIAEYRQRHAEVWPEMLQALKDTGWNNYSLFLRADGLLIGYLETPDLAAAQAGMAATEVNGRWQAEMGEFFADLEVAPDTGFMTLTEVFNLEDQLATPGLAPTEGIPA